MTTQALSPQVISVEKISELNKKYLSLTPIQRVAELYQDFNHKEIMLTSSFAATSALLLKLFSDTNKSQVICFIDTGYHFQETIIYKQYLTKLYDLKVEDVRAEKANHEKTYEEKTWVKSPNLCCSINKVSPLDKLKNSHSVWVSGLMSWQSNHRSSLNIFEVRNGILKFYPLLDVSQSERDNYIKDHHLPFHPLVSKGYLSIGCSHCTVPGNGRDGRWNNSPKTECGLHL
ncbi:MAG TPA: phosphoadenylyl-sulfate reductase [Flavobacteriales bacterium]|nr:phosphoadenylyl-sulfate reductase [Flavobacteriales bacterium]HIB76926.1 phosphoadenylyl-sulfate reductase [Flavobacteriales bacterium]HIN41940.1 phosphoadenylyl-sulfate reductase [Flavobacteriales bacterium]HIO16372.1 phosphoadenylyl-sulfate reductase [Flavobacteriales bacterium]HIO59908.1 phosphoadenylyl-sulfate reductase [Flavobacteriales bacterium]